MAALLASMAAQVISVEINPQFSRDAAGKLERAGIYNVILEVGDGAQGWDGHAPYDAVILTGSLPYLPESFRRCLALNGRLVAVVGRDPVMEAVRCERIGETGWQTTSLFDTSLPVLRNAAAPSAFVF
jgi:protein-L-isoaspartate(D-aspartate) O-methyltransferase